jgi:Uma2 family endonuclease
MHRLASNGAITLKPPRRVTYHEFLRMELVNPHVEWVDGEIVEMPPVSGSHSNVTTFLISILRAYADASGGEIRAEPFQMKTGPTLPGRAPDVIYVSKRAVKRLKESHLEGPADVVVEVISPSYRRVDRVTKFQEYEQGGVREYWLVDPERKQLEFHYRARGGEFVEIEPDDKGRIHSKVLAGLWLNPEWLWQKPFPKVVWVLKQLKLA